MNSFKKYQEVNVLLLINLLKISIDCYITYYSDISKNNRHQEDNIMNLIMIKIKH